jgi:hypothetical protein
MVKIKDNNYLRLFFFWGIVQAILLFYFGIKTDGEAETVITNATNLIANHHFYSQRIYLYFTEIFLVILKIKLGLPYGCIVVIHLMLNLAALFSLYRFTVQFYSSKHLGLLVALLIIFCWPYQIHNTYLSTESVFFSLSTIYTCYLLSTKKVVFTRVMSLSLLLLLVCITRPSGLFFFAATVMYLFVKLAPNFNLWIRLSALGMLTIAGLVIINYFTHSGNGYDFIIPFKEEHIICGVSSLPNFKEGQMATENSLTALAIYLMQHSGQFFRLALLKSKAFFCLTRPSYSFMHNLFLIAYFYSLYIMAAIAIGKHKKQISAELVFLLALIVVYWLSVVFTCDDWGNRFFLTLTPWFVLIAVGIFKKKTLFTKRII